MSGKKIVIEPACPHCRQLTGHASSCLTLFGVDAQIATDPCAFGLHRWAWLTSGRQACGVCGTERR